MRWVLFCVLPVASHACDEGETLYFACSVSNGAKTVEICHDMDNARYAFGPPGAPELTINAPVTEVHLTPWPGIGRDVWEEIIFSNQGYSYLVVPHIARHYPDDENAEIEVTVSGAIFVEKGGKPVAQLDCDAGSADFPWDTALFAAKEAKGQCYDTIARQWNSC